MKKKEEKTFNRKVMLKLLYRLQEGVSEFSDHHRPVQEQVYRSALRKGNKEMDYEMMCRQISTMSSSLRELFSLLVEVAVELSKAREMVRKKE